MNKLYDKNLYFLSLITWCLNPLDFNYTKEGIEINYDDYKIVINGKIDSSSNFTYVLPKKKQDFIKNNFNEFYINDVLYQIKLFIKHFCKRKL